VLWVLVGALVTLLGAWLVVLARHGYHRWRYGLPIAHDELLMRYGRRMASLLDRDALTRLLAVEVPEALAASRSLVLLVENHDLVAIDGSSRSDAQTPGLRLPVLHAAQGHLRRPPEALPHARRQPRRGRLPPETGRAIGGPRPGLQGGRGSKGALLEGLGWR